MTAERDLGRESTVNRMGEEVRAEHREFVRELGDLMAGQPEPDPLEVLAWLAEQETLKPWRVKAVLRHVRAGRLEDER